MQLLVQHCNDEWSVRRSHGVENPRQFGRCTRRRVARTDVQDADPFTSPLRGGINIPLSILTQAIMTRL
jgi:hypothetical protein